MRSRPGSAPTSCANGRAGAGAATVSPSARSRGARRARPRCRAPIATRRARRRACRRARCSRARARCARATASARRARSSSRGCGSTRRRRSRARPRPCRSRPRPPSRRSTRRWCASCPTDCGVGPYASGSVVGTSPSSGVFVRPTHTKPASRKRCASASVWSARQPASFRKRMPSWMRVALDAAEQVLEERRHAAERAVGQRALRRGARGVEQRMDDRVQLRVQLLDVVDRGVDELERRRVAGADELGLRGGVELGEVGHRSLFSSGQACTGGRRSRPRSRLFELRGDPDQEVFAERRAHELHADREARRRSSTAAPTSRAGR